MFRLVASLLAASYQPQALRGLSGGEPVQQDGSRGRSYLGSAMVLDVWQDRLLEEGGLCQHRLRQCLRKLRLVF